MIQNDKSKLLDEINDLNKTINKLENENKMIQNEIIILKKMLPSSSNSETKLNKKKSDYSINMNDKHTIDLNINNLKDNIYKKTTLKQIDKLEIIDINYNKFKKLLINQCNNEKKVLDILNDLNIHSNCKLEKNTIENIIMLIKSK